MKYELKERTDSNTSRVISQHLNPYQQAQSPHVLQDSQSSPYELPVHKDIRTSFSADRNPLIITSPSKHVRSLIATLILIIGVVSGLCIYFLSPGTLTVGQLIAIQVCSYVLYLIIACICNELYSYLSHIEHGMYFQAEYNKIRSLIGRFKFYAQCYHNQIRVNQYQTTDSNGNRKIQVTTTTVKVVTHTATEYVTPAKTEDTSGSVDRIRAEKEIVFIHFRVNYRFLNDRSRIILDQLYQRFKMMNRRDAYQNYTSDYEIPGLVERQTFFVGQLNCKYLNWFLIFGLLGLVWPYSLWVEKKVDRFTVDLTKVLAF